MSEALDGEEGHDTTVQVETTERNYEAEARKMGWVPPEEFSAKKPGRVAKTAQEFVEDTDRISPHVKRMLDAERADFDERVKRLEKLNQNTVKMVERQFQEDLAAIRTAQKAAIKDGDDEEFDRLEAEKTARIKQGPDASSEQSPEEKFKQKNDWYDADETLTVMANGFSQRMMAAYHAKNGTVMPQDEMFKAVEEKVKASAEYREKYAKPPGRKHADVDGGSENGGLPTNDPLKGLSNTERAKAKADVAQYPKFYPTLVAWREQYESKG